MTVNNKIFLLKRKKSYIYITNAMALQREITPIALVPSSYIISICLEDRNVFARFDEISSMTIQGIKETLYISH